MTYQTVVLCILDGWGESPFSSSNSISVAHTPVWTRLRATCPFNTLQASEEHVGLPHGQMGNSEVGHMTIGLGRTVPQDLPRINQALSSEEAFQLPAYRQFVQAVKADSGRCHLMGLLSPGGVHSHQDHLLAFAKHLSQSGVTVFVHAFLDGRDTPPQSAKTYVSQFLKGISHDPTIRFATVSGRYYALDRDKRWDRTEKAYQTVVFAEGRYMQSPLMLIDEHYARGIGDEFIPPQALKNYTGMQPGDGLFMVNFRADRVRQLLHALVDPTFSAFPRLRPPQFSATLGLTPYGDALVPLVPPLFDKHPVSDSLGEVIAKAGKKQLRAAETEKYAHVTFFLNGGREVVFPGEERLMVPSPAVATYDLAPEMSAESLTDAVVKAIRSQAYALIVVNFANADMVGHTGVVPAIITAIETVDRCLGRLETTVREAPGCCILITADHGNAEMMTDTQTGHPHTAHTVNPVPVLLVNGPAGSLSHGTLADIAPTILSLLGLAHPRLMTGNPLLHPSQPGHK